MLISLRYDDEMEWDHFRLLQKKRNEIHRLYKFTRPTSGKKGLQIITTIEQTQLSIVNKSTPIFREKIGAYRFLNNEKIRPLELIKSLQNQCSVNCVGQDVIVLQDTTEYNYQHLRRRHKSDSLGVVGNNSDVGYFAHPAICFDASSRLPQGISYCKIWSRDPNRQEKDKWKYKNIPIEDKESYRWIEAVEQTKVVLSQAAHITFISDRESDIYQLLSRAPDERTDLIIRSRDDRKLYDRSGTMTELLNELPHGGNYRIKLQGDYRKQRKKREALLNIKWSEVIIRKPDPIAKSQIDKEFVVLTVVEAREDASTCTDGDNPVHWLLLTTKKVGSFDQACQIIDGYCFRWMIEQFNRITKQKGIDLESSQLETAEGLQRLGILGFNAALKILQLTLAREGTHDEPIGKYFEKEETEVLEILDNELKGTTVKQSNPFPLYTLAWAAWIIARLGGFSGYKSQSPPGPITMKCGLDKFNMIKAGYLIARKNVYKE
jgi:hypothetical protein